MTSYWKRLKVVKPCATSTSTEVLEKPFVIPWHPGVKEGSPHLTVLDIEAQHVSNVIVHGLETAFLEKYVWPVCRLASYSQSQVASPDSPENRYHIGSQKGKRRKNKFHKSKISSGILGFTNLPKE